MKAIIVLGIIFTVWEGIITHLFPTHSQEYYRKAAEKWSTGLKPALIGWMDMISLFGLFAVGILSFFFMSVVQAVIFCIAMFVVVMVGGTVSGKKALKRAKEE